MSDADSFTATHTDDPSPREVLCRLSRSLTTVRLGVPLLDDALHPQGDKTGAIIQDLCTATLAATLDLAVLSGRLIREERARTLGRLDRPTGGTA
jgi:hypothetical protein